LFHVNRFRSLSRLVLCSGNLWCAVFSPRVFYGRFSELTLYPIRFILIAVSQQKYSVWNNTQARVCTKNYKNTCPLAWPCPLFSCNNSIIVGQIFIKFGIEYY
jgi:hypothetical protein